MCDTNHGRNKEAIFFNNIDELKEKLLFLHKNREYVLTLKQAALKRSMNSGYSYLDRATELLKIVNYFISYH